MGARTVGRPARHRGMGRVGGAEVGGMSIIERFAPQRESKAAMPSSLTIGTGSTQTTYSAQGRTEGIADAVADISFVYEIHRGVLSYAAPVPIKVFDLDSNGDREEAPTHPSYALLRKPNPRHNATSFREFLFASRLSFGEHFIAKQRDDRGRVIALWPLRPDRLMEVPDPDTGELLGFMLNYNSPEPQALPLSELIWGTSYHPSNDYRGLSPIAALRWQVEIGRDAEQTMADFMANGAFLRGALHVQRKAGVESLSRVAEQFRSLMVGSGNRFRVPVFQEGMEYKPIQLTPADAEFINTAKLTRSRVAAAFGWALPEEWAASQAADVRRLRFADAVVPLADAITASLVDGLMPEFGGGAAFPEFQLAHLLQAELPQLIAAGKDAIYSAQYTPNEWRKKFLNLPPKPGGDDLFVPLNLDSAVDVQEDNATPRQADSAGGLGGDEGRTESTAGWKPSEGLKRLRARQSEVKDLSGNYGRGTRRKQEKLAQALHNRIKGVLKKELAEIRNTGKAVLPAATDLERIVRKHDPELAKLIGQFLTQSAIASAEAAGFLLGADPIDPSRFAEAFATRADAVSAQFGTERGSWLMNLLSDAQAGDLGQRDFMNAVADGYGEKFSSYGERLARTEVAHASEEAARAQWADAGATGVVWNFVGGPCTTGDCEAMSGAVAPTGSQFDSAEFGGIDGPPSHNNCTCFTTPTFDSLTGTEG